jgi:hypothetical protein
VMQRANKQDCIKAALMKIGPNSDARIDIKAPRSGNGLAVAVNRDDGISILRQSGSQLACSTADLKDTSAFARKESFNKIVGITCFEPHVVSSDSALDVILSAAKNVRSFYLLGIKQVVRDVSLRST